MPIDWGGTGCVQNGVATLNCIPVVLNNLISSLLIFSGVVGAMVVIFSSYKMISSRGDPKRMHTAKAAMAYGILGLVLVLLAFFIVNLIAYVTKTDCIKVFGFSNCQ
jgi:uncharacterized membrane protein HdeD (DUF308 family)